ncbi:DUF2284 domain-containing protein [Caldisalinibacter kiritimatiensis]|uniref:DUF2284 domain-containing protein n=1 Tax=Caldisalinibacter kiritimatiensis TaxID=1304284 RepID=UPI00138AF611|nr:DUF2284 domain-containing protein [Caldisalinibacter kiritimatiensis]
MIRLNYNDKLSKIKGFIYSKGVHLVKDIYPTEIIIDEKVRKYCKQNKCGEYGNNFMCPPFVGSIEDFREELKKYKHGLIVMIKDRIVNGNDENRYYNSAKKLHNILLEVENECKKNYFNNVKVLIGGNCRICNPCVAALGEEKCKYPKKARPSLEAMGIDVVNTCKQIGIVVEFKTDEVMWIGLVLL